MKAYWLIVPLAALTLVACREAEDLPNPFTDAGAPLFSNDAGPIPDGAVGGPCPCHPSLTEVQAADGGCVCRMPCEPAQPVPRCDGWEVCAQLRSGSALIDAGVCLPAAAPNSACSPTPCAETLLCASLSGRDAGNTCRYHCDWTGDAAVAGGSGTAPAQPGECPSGQRCYNMNNIDGGACFNP